MKKGLALCGGGALGIYQVGAWKALRELGIEFDIITGTSIGALNAAMIIQGDFDKTNELWDTINISRIMNKGFDIEEVNIRKIIKHSDFKPFLASYVKGFGSDIKPFKEMINEYLDASKIRNSKTKFGVVVTQFPSIKKEEKILNELNDEEMFNYILATASCFPVFPICKINSKQYIDGGYVDNLPIDFNLRLGANKVVAIDLKPYVTHKEYLKNPVVDYIYPKWNLGSFLYFNPNFLNRNRCLGYYDVMKYYNKFDGFKYTFDKTEKYNELANEVTNVILSDLIYFKDKKKKYFFKKEEYKNLYEYLTMHIYNEITCYDYFIKTIEAIGYLLDIPPIKNYDISDFLYKIKETMKSNKDLIVGEEFVLLNNDSKRKDFINEVDKKKFLHFINNVKQDYNFKILLLQMNVELYLSLICIEYIL